MRCSIDATGSTLAPERVGDEDRFVRGAGWLDRDAAPAPFPAFPMDREAATGSGTEIVTEVRSARPAPAPDRRRTPAPARCGPQAVKGAANGLGPAVLALLTVGVGMAAVAHKDAVVRAFPPGAAVFSAVGLPVNLRGLALNDVAGAIAPQGPDPVLTLTGRISNLRDGVTAVPSLRVAIRDGDHREIYSWTAPPPKAALAAGEAVPFRSRLAAPPEGAREIVVTFGPA